MGPYRLASIVRTSTIPTRVDLRRDPVEVNGLLHHSFPSILLGLSALVIAVLMRNVTSGMQRKLQRLSRQKTPAGWMLYVLVKWVPQVVQNEVLT